MSEAKHTPTPGQARKPGNSKLVYDKATRAIVTVRDDALHDDLVKALEHAADFIKGQDDGDPSTETGWKSEEHLEAWLGIHAVLQRARGGQA